MGIKGIYKPLRKQAPEAVSQISLSHLRGKRVAIDACNFMYRSRYANTQGCHLTYFGQLFCELKENGIDAYWVFDGEPPPEKEETLAERKKKREEHRQEMKRLEESIVQKKIELGLLDQDGTPSSKKQALTPKQMAQIESLEAEKQTKAKKVVIVEPAHIEETMELLRILGAKVVKASSEGEADCATLNRLGFVDAVIAEDSDVIAFGGISLVRGVSTNNQGKTGMTLWNIPAILEKLDLTPESFVEASILCGSDYVCGKIPGLGPVTALKMIRQLSTIEVLVEHLKPKQKAAVKEGFNPAKARKIFYRYLNMSQVPAQYHDVETRTPERDRLAEFLKERVPFPDAVLPKWFAAASGKPYSSSEAAKSEQSDMLERFRGLQQIAGGPGSSTDKDAAGKRKCPF
jgi:5'-3' exonuclease